MSVENLYPNINKGLFLPEEDLDRNFSYLRDRYSTLTARILDGDDSDLGAGRLFFRTSAVVSYGMRFQPGFTSPSLKDVEGANEVFHSKIYPNAQRIPPISVNQEMYCDSSEIKRASGLISIQSAHFFHVMVNVVSDDTFPLNIYDGSFAVNSNVYSDINFELAKLMSAISSFNNLNVSGSVTSFPFKEDPEKLSLVSADYPVSNSVRVLGASFRKNFHDFMKEKPRNLSKLGAVYADYGTRLSMFIDLFKQEDNYSVRVLHLNVIGPYAFLDIILELTKHACDMRANTFIGDRMIQASEF